MRKPPAFIAILLASVVGALTGADWLQYGGDPERSGWQRRERFLNTGNASQIKLLWKLKLNNQSRGSVSLSSPTLLGPIITHRGIKELVFVAGASDRLFAVDADLGRLFWEVHFEPPSPAGSGVKPPCGRGLTAAPAVAPSPPVPGKPVDDDEGTTPLRPLYVLSSDGNLHNLRPSDGRDMAIPLKFLPPNANASDLNLSGNMIYTSTSANCGGVPDGVWGIDVANPNATARFTAATNTPNSAGVSVGLDGTVHAGVGTLLASAARHAIGSAPEHGRVTSLSMWQDARGTRLIFAATESSVRAFIVSGKELRPAPVWTSRALVSPAAPVVAKGILFVLSRGNAHNHATLYALDAATGKELYSSGGAIDSYSTSGGIAVANGHVCFGSFDNTLYCFGFPIEIN